MTPLGVAAEIAAPQHGVVARRQLLRAGLSRDQVDHLVAAGTLILLYRGVYAVGHRPVGLRSREMAVVLLAGRSGALAWDSAAGLWAMRRWAGLRTLLDLSQTLPLDALDAALAEALVRKLVTLEELLPRARGQLRALLETAAPTRSRLERDLRRLLRDHGLPQPISNGIVEGYEVDLHWPEQKLVAELDGYEFHAHRRAFETDRLRDQMLVAAGHRVVRVTDRQLTNQRAETAHRFTALLTQSL